ncbi:hypothetical protein [Paenibacillus sp. MDMC362]|nr:hypothetical protein [Paenibacillus sp. MDMC362]
MKPLLVGLDRIRTYLNLKAMKKSVFLSRPDGADSGHQTPPHTEPLTMNV